MTKLSYRKFLSSKDMRKKQGSRGGIMQLLQAGTFVHAEENDLGNDLQSSCCNDLEQGMRWTLKKTGSFIAQQAT